MSWITDLSKEQISVKKVRDYRQVRNRFLEKMSWITEWSKRHSFKKNVTDNRFE